MSAAKPTFEIKVARVEPALRDDKPVPNTVMVTFAIVRPKGWPSFEIPIPVSTEHYDEQEMIKVARSYLHATAEALQSQTETWKLSQEWFDKHRQAPKQAQ